jgi:hypothetical protein
VFVLGKSGKKVSRTPCGALHDGTTLNIERRIAA